METTCRYHEQHEIRMKSLEDQASVAQESMRTLDRMEVTLEHMRRQLGDIDNRVKEIDRRLDILERMPGESAVAYWKVVITSLITGGLGFLLAQLLK